MDFHRDTSVVYSNRDPNEAGFRFKIACYHKVKQYIGEEGNFFKKLKTHLTMRCIIIMISTAGIVSSRCYS